MGSLRSHQHECVTHSLFLITVVNCFSLPAWILSNLYFFCAKTARLQRHITAALQLVVLCTGRLYYALKPVNNTSTLLPTHPPMHTLNPTQTQRHVHTHMRTHARTHKTQHTRTHAHSNVRAPSTHAHTYTHTHTRTHKTQHTHTHQDPSHKYTGGLMIARSVEGMTKCLTACRDFRSCHHTKSKAATQSTKADTTTTTTTTAMKASCVTVPE